MVDFVTMIFVEWIMNLLFKRSYKWGCACSTSDWSVETLRVGSGLGNEVFHGGVGAFEGIADVIVVVFKSCWSAGVDLGVKQVSDIKKLCACGVDP